MRRIKDITMFCLTPFIALGFVVGLMRAGFRGGELAAGEWIKKP